MSRGSLIQYANAKMQVAARTLIDTDTSRENRGVPVASRDSVKSDGVANGAAEDSCSAVVDILMAPFVAAIPNQGAVPLRFETTVPIAVSTPAEMVV